MSNSLKHFLFLQGPHGPFFKELARALQAEGAKVSRLGFNQGDRYEWPQDLPYAPFNQPLEDLPDFLAFHFKARQVTDVVLYGDTRPAHRKALEAARRAGVRTHILEEGYLRPYWFTYERQGANGYSRLMALTLEDMDAQGCAKPVYGPPPPARWGSTRQHIKQSLRYHFRVWRLNGAYPHYQRHRELTLSQELAVWIRRLARRPLDIGRRELVVERRLRRDDRPCFMVLLQLGFDPSMSAHSDFRNLRQIVEHCAQSFAEAAPEMDPRTVLIFKSHPLEDGRERLHKLIPETARRFGLEGRVIFVDGGPLAELLERPSLRGVVTVNSTAAHQSLGRGLPTKALGRAIYDKPGLTSRRPDLKSFFTHPDAPDKHAYHAFQKFLETTSQIRGGFYADHERGIGMKRLVGMMLAQDDPYDSNLRPAAREGWTEAAE